MDIANKTSVIIDNEPEGILSLSAVKDCRFVLNFCINPVLYACALGTNVVNIVVFCKMGLRDGVTQNFFVLSVSDCSWGFLGVVYNVTYILWIKRLWGWDISTVTLVMISSAAINLPRNISMISTVIIAVVRCCCVAMPLTVRTVITARRQLIVILTCSALAFAAFLYVAMSYQVVWRVNPHTNTHQYLMNYTADLSQRLAFNDIYRNILFNTSIAVALLCLIILVVALKRSSQFQKQATSTDKEGGKSKTSQRDKQVIKTVVLVLVMFTSCNLLSVIWSLLRQLIPDFRIWGRYQNIFELTYMLSESMNLVNAGATMFIYYFTNTRYKTVALRLLFRNGEVSGGHGGSSFTKVKAEK